MSKAPHSKTWKIGTRGSELALVQANLLLDALQSQYPERVFELKTIVTTGDRRVDVPLAEVATTESAANPSNAMDKGVFIRELEAALKTGEIDMAVHSAKDMPSVLDPSLAIACFLPREDVEDVLISKKKKWTKGVIGTSSVRRRKMAESYFGKENVSFVDVRGNVQTRLSKLAKDDTMGAIVLARAGLNRLDVMDDEERNAIYWYADDKEGTIGRKVEKLYVRSLPLENFVPAAGQGAIAVEILSRRADVRELLAPLNHKPTEIEVSIEREFLRLLEGDCTTPVGASAKYDMGQIDFNVMRFEDDCPRPLETRICGTYNDDPEGIAFLAWCDDEEDESEA